MNKYFRLAFLKDLNSNPEKVIDFTRYDLPAHLPQELSRNWSLLGKINQKQARPQVDLFHLKNWLAKIGK